MPEPWRRCCHWPRIREHPWAHAPSPTPNWKTSSGAAIWPRRSTRTLATVSRISKTILRNSWWRSLWKRRRECPSATTRTNPPGTANGRPLLDGQTFGQIARLIDVSAFEHGDMISEQLHRDGEHDGRLKGGCWRGHFDHCDAV